MALKTVARRATTYSPSEYRVHSPGTSTKTAYFRPHALGTSRLPISMHMPTIHVTGSLTENWRLARPLTLDAILDDGFFIISYDKLQAYGAGESVMEALTDFVSMLIEQYEELLEDEPILAPGLKQLLENYRANIVPI